MQHRSEESVDVVLDVVDVVDVAVAVVVNVWVDDASLIIDMAILFAWMSIEELFSAQSGDSGIVSNIYN